MSMLQRVIQVMTMMPNIHGIEAGDLDAEIEYTATYRFLDYDSFSWVNQLIVYLYSADNYLFAFILFIAHYWKCD